MEASELLARQNSVEIEDFADFGCIHCNSNNMTDCLNNGEYAKCRIGEVCQTEIRKRDGEVRGVTMRCKSAVACNDNRKQNFKGDWKSRQCRPDVREGPSVCRQCCSTDRCTDNFNPDTWIGWR